MKSVNHLPSPGNSGGLIVDCFHAYACLLYLEGHFPSHHNNFDRTSAHSISKRLLSSCILLRRHPLDYPNLPRAMDLVKGRPQGTEVEARAEAEGAKDAEEVEKRELRHEEQPQLAQTEMLHPKLQLKERLR